MASFEQEIKQKKAFASGKEKALVNLLYTSNWVTDKLNAVFSGFDLTHQQYNVLRILRGSYPQPLNCTSIKEVMLDKNPDVTRLCNRLESKGLLTRGSNKDNRRQIHIIITNAGLDLLNDIEPLMRRQVESSCELTADEAETLSQLLDKIRCSKVEELARLAR